MNADKILDEITAKIVQLLIENPTIYYNKSQIARHADVSRDALYNRLDALLAHGVLKEVEVGNEHTHYKLNQDSPSTNAIAQLLYPEGDTDN